MKSDGFQRSVRAKSKDRSAGDAPSIGRVGRMRGAAAPSGDRRTRERGQPQGATRAVKENRMVIAAWSAGLALMALLLLGGAVWMWMRPRMAANQANSVAAASKIEAVAPSVNTPSLTEEESLKVVRDALACRDEAEIAQHFRLNDSTPAEAVEFLSSMNSKEGEITSLEWLGSSYMNGLNMEGVLVNLAGKDKPRNRLAMLVPDESGKWAVDFDAFARVNKPRLGDIIAGNETEGVARVYVARDTYYNGVFSDDSRWISFGVASPDEADTINGYCEVNSPQAKALEKMLSLGSPMVRAAIEVRRVEGSLPRQLEITRVVAEDWVITENGFDQKFR